MRQLRVISLLAKRALRVKLAAVLISVAICCLLLSGGTSASSGMNGKIAFESDRDGNYEIYVMNSDGSGQTQLTVNNAFDGFPSWQSIPNITTFQKPAGISDYGIIVLTVDGNQYTFGQLPVSFTWKIGSSHNFSWNASPNASDDRQYMWNSSSGPWTS
jgi:hypothetical protein